MKKLPIKQTDELYTIGTKTKWGTIRGVGFYNGERTYFIIDDKHPEQSVGLIPHGVLRASFVPSKTR